MAVLPSDNFKVIFPSASTSSAATCEFCQTTYFCNSHESSLSEDELKNFEELQKKTPKKYIAVDDWIRFGTILNKEFVVGCKCGVLATTEKFLLDNQDKILSYYRMNLKQAETRVAHDREQLSNFNNI